MLTGVIKKRFVAFLIAVVVIVAAVSALGGFISRRNGGKPNFITNTVSTVVAPVQGAFSWVYDNICGVGDYFADIKRLKKENVQLKTRVLELERDIAKTENFEQENERLRGLLDLQENLDDYETVGAEVISRDANFSAGKVRINKGKSDGISKNDVVTDGRGLVGYVSKVGTNWADVTTILTPGTGVSCILPRTGEILMLESDIEGSRKLLCKMSYISSDSTISTGEAVETSGEGGIYPKGLFVGRIESIGNENGISKEATLKPGADFKALREVLVIKMSGGEEKND